tara:strand:+ start:50913 stop:51110 length:198 start_codon:yes stop_codon:yes gene_type:complete
MPNLAWSFSQIQLKTELNLIELFIINDYLATASVAPYLEEHEKQKVGQGSIRLTRLLLYAALARA